MKIIVTTSDKYHHLLPVFFYLYNKYWGEPFDLVGYAKPACELPDNCTWVSLGVQGAKTEFSNDLRKYFELQADWFVWMMEDTFLKGNVFRETTDLIYDCVTQKGWDAKAGRVDLTSDVSKRPHGRTGESIFIYAESDTRYRLSTQPSMWNKGFLLQYLTPGLSPWDFETQDPKNDGWNVYALVYPPLQHNEGVRRFDIHKLNLDGMKQEDIDHINTIYK